MNRLLAFLSNLFGSPAPADMFKFPRDPLAIVSRNNQIEVIWLPFGPEARRVVPCNARMVDASEGTKARDSPVS